MNISASPKTLLIIARPMKTSIIVKLTELTQLKQKCDRLAKGKANKCAKKNWAFLH